MDFFSTAQIVGYVALVLGITSFAQKNDRKLKFFNACQGVAYCIHFFLLGNLTASGSAVVSSVRSFTALFYKRKWLFFVFIAINLTNGIFLAKTPQAWLPIIGCSLATFGLFFCNGLRMRFMFLTSTVMWITNNILSGSIGGTVLECMIFVTNSTTIIRMILATFSRSRITMTGGIAALHAAAPNEKIQRHFPFARRMYAKRRARSVARIHMARPDRAQR